jgi:hypothetical protein
VVQYEVFIDFNEDYDSVRGKYYTMFLLSLKHSGN